MFSQCISTVSTGPEGPVFNCTWDESGHWFIGNPQNTVDSQLLNIYFGSLLHQCVLTLTRFRVNQHPSLEGLIFIKLPHPISPVTIALLFWIHTVRLLTHVLCKPTHFFFLSFIAAISYSPQTSFNSVMKDWADKYHVIMHREHLQYLYQYMTKFTSATFSEKFRQISYVF